MVPVFVFEVDFTTLRYIEFYQAYLYLVISPDHKCLEKYKNKLSAVRHITN